jgi:PAS domain S-box-containing protein
MPADQVLPLFADRSQNGSRRKPGGVWRMTWQFNTYVPLMLVAGAISSAVGVFTLRQRHSQGAIGLAVASFGGTLWALAIALQFASGSLASAVVFHKLAFLGMDVIGVAMLAFAAAYSGRSRWVTTGSVLALSLLPALTQVFVWTSDSHTLIWKALQMDLQGSMAVLHETPGVWWWVDTVYTYVLLAAAIALLARMFFKEPGLYRRQATALIAAVVVPVAADVAYVYGAPSAETANLTPLFFAWVGLVLYWGFVRYRLLDVGPAAREFIIAHMSDSVVATDTRDRVVYLNAAAEKLIGKRLAAVGGQPVAEILEWCPGLLLDLADIVGCGADISDECEYEGRFYDARRSVFRDGRDRFRGTIIVLRDSTDRKKAQLGLEEARRNLEDRVRTATVELRAANAELTESRTRLAHLLSSSPAVIYCREASGTGLITFVGSNLESQLGYKMEEVLGDPGFWASLVHPDDREHLPTIDEAVQKREVSCEYRLLAPDGSYRWIHDRMRVVTDGAGRGAELIGSWLEVTDRRAMEEQLHQSSKMEAIGLLAGGIAHDFNNLLTAIGGYAELIQDVLTADDLTHKGIVEIRRAVDRAAGLTRQLLAFSRKQVLRPRVLNLNSVVKSTAELFGRLIGEHIEFSTELADDLGLVTADPGQMEQVCMNLVVNARDAMPEGGRIIVRTENVELTTDGTGVYAEVPAGSYVGLSVIDTGGGIPENVLPHIFEPFFTTKRDGGTGLGLATVYGIAGQSGGRITVDSVLGKGSVFQLLLPRLQGEVEELAAPVRIVSDQPVGSETVLIVEDEAGVRSLLVMALRRRGFLVYEADGAEQAKEVIELHGPPDVLVTDVVMRTISGPELVKELQVTYPKLPVLYMSGYARDKLDEALSSSSDVSFLQKPFTTDTLITAVREILQRV